MRITSTNNKRPVELMVIYDNRMSTNVCLWSFINSLIWSGEMKHEELLLMISLVPGGAETPLNDLGMVVCSQSSETAKFVIKIVDSAQSNFSSAIPRNFSLWGHVCICFWVTGCCLLGSRQLCSFCHSFSNSGRLMRKT